MDWHTSTILPTRVFMHKRESGPYVYLHISTSLPTRVFTSRPHLYRPISQTHAHVYLHISVITLTRVSYTCTYSSRHTCICTQPRHAHTRTYWSSHSCICRCDPAHTCMYIWELWSWHVYVFIIMSTHLCMHQQNHDHMFSFISVIALTRQRIYKRDFTNTCMYA